MVSLSITAAWNEAAAFVKREARLLFPIAFMLVALPSGLLQLLMPVTAPGQPPQGGLWLLLIPLTAILGMIGTLALASLALRAGMSVAEALQHGARRMLSLLGATLLLVAAAMLVLMPLMLIGGGAATVGARTAAPEAAAGGVLLVMLVFLVLAIALWVRLMLMTPVAAAEEVGPIGIIRRSWALTKGHFWKLLGFVLLMLLLFIVLSAVVGAIGGLLIVLLAGQPSPGSLAHLLVILLGIALNTVVTVYFIAMIARIYRQLSGGGTQDVFA